MNHRPRVTINNGVRRTRTYHFYWCRQCQRSIRTTTTNPSEILCPHCLGQIRLELHVSRPGPILEPSPGRRLLDSLAQMLDPYPYPRQQNQEPAHRAGILLQFIGPDDDPRPVFPEELTGNNRTSPTAVPEPVIRALPTVELTSEDNKCCPICKDEFATGVQVKELPCKHFYHFECIVPWLRIQNTCPVCRHEVRGASIDSIDDNFQDSQSDYDFEGFRFGEQQGNWINDSDRNWSWAEIFSSRPFCWVLNFVQLCLEFVDDRVHNVTGEDGSSWWRSLTSNL